MNDTMNSKQAELWKEIEAFTIDDQTGETGLSFESRLARENAWSRETARRVIEEYKRFVFLAMCAGHPVTPSDQVDQAWHLHLTYTRSYWERLCGGVLPKPLHHDPTRGGAAEDDKFNDWYARTKQSYQRLFGAEAPAEVWPDASVRFGDDLHFQRINTYLNWVVSKRRVKWSVRVALVVGLPGAALVGCTPLLLSSSGSEDGSLAVGILIFFGVMVLLLGIAGLFRRANGGGSRGSCGSSGSGGWFFGGGCGTSHTSHHGSHDGHGASDSHGGGSDGSSGCGSSGCSGGGCGGGGCGGGGD